MSRRCKLLPSWRKHTGEAGIGLGSRSVSESQKIPWWDRNLSLRGQSQIRVWHPSFLAGRDSSDFVSWLWGEVDTPMSPWGIQGGSGCQGAPVSPFKVTKTKVTIAVQLIQSSVCAFGRQCWVHFLWASWEIWIHADKGEGDEQPFVGNQCVLKLSGLILSQRARRLCCQLLQLSHFFTSPQ